jgi:hypothetical protein
MSYCVISSAWCLDLRIEKIGLTGHLADTLYLGI